MNAELFLKSFKELIKSLEEDENVELLFSSIGFPAKEKSLRGIRDRWKEKIPESFFDLFKISNGLQCVWNFKNSKRKNKNKSPIKSFRAVEPIFSEWYYDG